MGQKTVARKSGIAVGASSESDDLPRLAGGLDIFQALWNKDEAAWDAHLRSGVETQTVCEDKNYSTSGQISLRMRIVMEQSPSSGNVAWGGADPNFKDSEERTAFCRMDE